jgi:hypothetical protein
MGIRERSTRSLNKLGKMGLPPTMTNQDSISSRLSKSLSTSNMSRMPTLLMARRNNTQAYMRREIAVSSQFWNQKEGKTKSFW